jgi:hypothetical protein
VLPSQPVLNASEFGKLRTISVRCDVDQPGSKGVLNVAAAQERLAVRLQECDLALSNLDQAEHAGCEQSIGDAQRAWWNAASRALFELMRLAHAQTGKNDGLPLLLAALGRVASDAHRGVLHNFVARAMPGHRPQVSSAIADAIGRGVAYHMAATAKGLEASFGISVRVSDRHPTKTLAEAFRVSPKTVREWVRHYQPVLNARDVSSERIAADMQKAAAQYRLQGHSPTAIAQRDGKRAKA